MRAVLAHCRSRLGKRLVTTGHDDEAMSVLRLARADRRRWPPPPGRRPSRPRPGGNDQSIGNVLAGDGQAIGGGGRVPQVAGDRAEAGRRQSGRHRFAKRAWRPRTTTVGSMLCGDRSRSAARRAYRQALAIQQKLADDNPAVTGFRESPGDDPHQPRACLLEIRASHRRRRPSTGRALAIRQKLADDNPCRPAIPQRPGTQPQPPRLVAVEYGQVTGSGGRVPQGTGTPQKLADDNPAIADFRSGLAQTLDYIGWQLAQAGKTDEAIGYYMREEAIRQKLAQASSAAPHDRNSLANCQTNTADALRRSGRLEQALAACERALAVREALAEANPNDPWYRPGLGETYLRLGRCDATWKTWLELPAAWKRACAHYEANRSLDGEATLFLACCHACLAGLAGRAGSGSSAAHGTDQAERAMALLRQAVTLGYRNPDVYRTESALDPLRTRPDFQAADDGPRDADRAVRASETRGSWFPIPVSGFQDRSHRPKARMPVSSAGPQTMFTRPSERGGRRCCSRPGTCSDRAR